MPEHVFTLRCLPADAPKLRRLLTSYGVPYTEDEPEPEEMEPWPFPVTVDAAWPEDVVELRGADGTRYRLSIEVA